VETTLSLMGLLLLKKRSLEKKYLLLLTKLLMLLAILNIQLIIIDSPDIYNKYKKIMLEKDIYSTIILSNQVDL